MRLGKPPLWLVHGWGFGPGFWRPLMACLPEWPVYRADLGFFGVASLVPPCQPYVAVGHSLGFLRLLHDLTGNSHCLGLMGINGFSRFAQGPDFPHGVPPRLIQRMISRLEESPAQVVQEFRQRGGLTAPSDQQGQTEVLRQGLHHLLTLDGRRALAGWSPPLLVLAARDDLIVPPPLTAAAFPPPHGIYWSDTGGHLLPLTRAAWCGERLIEWVDNHGF